MKKYIPILLATSLLLSACSINFNTASEDLFEKKQKCQKYTDEIQKGIETRNNTSSNSQYFYNEILIEIFYSESKNSCFAYLLEERKILDSESKIKETNVILNILTGERISHERFGTTEEDARNFYNLLKELKGE